MALASDLEPLRERAAAWGEAHPFEGAARDLIGLIHEAAAARG